MVKPLSFGRCGFLLGTVALLAGCAGSQPSIGAPGALPYAAQRPAHAEGGRSWMLPQKKGGQSTLIYAAGASSVNVYDYSNGKLVGTLGGVQGSSGCVDAKGDVFIVQPSSTVEYAHAGTKPINTYSAGGEGCSVDSNGDLAVTAFSGEVTVYAKGNGKRGTTYSGSACGYQWTMGYDDKGNLIGVGEYKSILVCGLLAGSKTIMALSFNRNINFPGGTMWDGKYIGLTDQEANGKDQFGIIAAILSGSTLKFHHEAIFTDTCFGSGSDIVNPFIVGNKNTPVNDHQGSVVVGTDLWCDDTGSGPGIEFWHYPAGGNPFKNYSADTGTVLAVSIGT